MLYRQPRPSALSILRAVFARIIGFVAELIRTNADTAHIDSLNDNALRDLGIRRVESRDEHFYR
jgi:uncharacterized protein YjiS (DUF1127 family)